MMEPYTEKEWGRLVDSVKTLHDLSDKINSVIDRVNEELEKLSPGVGVWVEDLEVCGLKIGYAKTAGKWQLATFNSSNGMKDRDRILPLRGGSRELRCMAVPHLPRVFDAISDRVEEYAAHMQEVLEANDAVDNEQGE